jgi:hypothetical protein
MAKIKDLRGQKFGKLTPIQCLGTDKHYKAIWQCECDCGTITQTTSNNLKRGTTTSCGCVKFDRQGTDDETGNRYGRLLVKHSMPKRPTWWECECDCGNTVLVNGSKLRKAKSCGCYGETGNNSPNWTGYKDIDGKYWKNIQAGAKSRGHVFEIDLAYVWDIYIKQNGRCALSGLPIQFAYKNGHRQQRTASIDRIDSSKGYVKGNIQWLLLDINFMKQKFSSEHFIRLCKKVASNNV